MDLSTIFNSVGGGAQKVGQSLSGLFGPTHVVNAVTPPPTNINPDDAMYQQDSNVAKQKYGVTIPPYFLKSVRQQESSGVVDPKDYGRSFGLVNADGANGAKAALGPDYLPDTSLLNSATNAANYAASRAHFKSSDGVTKIDLSLPENLSKLYVQRYAGLLPGQSRVIGGQKVTYDKVKSLFEELLKKNQS